MIQPDKVRAEAKKKEDENFKFRSYLKGHADEAELEWNISGGQCKKNEEVLIWS